MADVDSQRTNQPITLRQKQLLIEVYQRTGNMSLAMREADIRSPRTAYLWWRRFCETGEVGLQPRSHARHTQARLPDEVVEHICDLRQEAPSWGRRGIASALALRYGEHASPAAIELTLRRAGLWDQQTQAPSREPQAATAPDWLRNGVDYDCLLTTVQEGVRLSRQSAVHAANSTLYHQIWRPLEMNPALMSQALATKRHRLGDWLLASRLALGHSLMNSGLWPQSARVLRETLDWMEAHSAAPHYDTDDDLAAAVSLRRDDIWLGCMHHLGLVLAKQAQSEVGIGLLQTALVAIHRTHRPVAPSDGAASGNLDRDLAHLKLRLRGFPKAEIYQHLRQAQQSAEASESLAVQAFTQFAWAKLHDRLARVTDDREQSTRRHYRHEMEIALHRALELVSAEPDDRPMRLTLCYVDATQLSHTHGMPIEKQWIQDAAAYCIRYGYGGQAQQLLAVPGVHLWLSADNLRKLARVAH